MISRISMKTNNTGSGKLICAFTLIELLLVLVLIAISMATIMPHLGRSIPIWQVRESSKNMLVTIRLARQLALTRQEIMVFAVDTNDASFGVRNISRSANSRGISNDFLLPRQFLGRGVKVAQLEGFKQIGGKKGLIFWPDGRTKTAHVILTTEKDSKMVEWHIIVENDGSAVLQEVFRNE